MVSGLAPGRAACTWIVGNSTWGSGATGKNWYAIIPASKIATVKREVAIGRFTKGSEMFTF
jgi:hypothetical protein